MTPARLAIGAACALLLLARTVTAAPGDLDPSFAGGAGFERLAVSPGFDDCHGMIVQADGRIVLAASVQQGTGSQIGLMRVNADGTLDPTFGVGGRQITRHLPAHFYVNAMLALADGRFVVVGSISTGGNVTRFMAARFLENGLPDNSFGEDGCVVPLIPENQSVATALAVQTDGKLVLAGWSWTGTDSRFVAARCNTDGTMDTSFDGDGVVETDLGTPNDYAHAVAIQSNGAIVLAGYTALSGQVSHMALVRYLSNGALDNSFDGDGRLSLSIGNTGDGAYALAIQRGSTGKPDRILVAGVGSNLGPTQNGIALARLNLNGTLDTGFDGDGKLLTLSAGRSLFTSALAITTDRGGTVLITVGGSASGAGEASFMAARYTSAGALDASFDGDGLAFASISAPVIYGTALRVVSGGLLLAGRADVNGGPDMAVARLTSAGALDPSFNGTGARVENVGAGSVFGDAVALQADGRILVAGNGGVLRRPFELVRCLPDGSLDTSFGTGGVADDAAGIGEAPPVGVVVQPDARIVVAGDQSPGAVAIRYLASGALDPTFGTGGVAQLNGVTTLNSLHALARQPDGKLLLAGDWYDTNEQPQHHYGMIVRLDTNGTLDGYFGFGGRTWIDSTDVLQAVAVDAQGRLVVAGTWGGQIVVVRLTPTGQIDDSFHGGRTNLSIGTGSSVAALLVQPDGKIALAGTSGGAFGDNVTLARLDANGTPDPGFGAGGVVVADLVLGNDRACALVRQANGSLLVGAQITNVTLEEGFFLYHGEFVAAAFRADGSPDPAYGQGGRRVVDLGFATDDAPRGLVLDAQGRALMVGSSEGTIGLCRLQAGGVTAVGDAPAPRPGAGFALSAPAPNPLRGVTRVSFELPNAGRVTAAVLDVSGRLVRRLTDAVLPPGTHEITWDGREDTGRSVAGGIYFMAVRTDAGSAARRILVTR
jgi:uncharacterized delta-60 repeat protein